MTSRLWSNPNARAAIKTLTWFPLLFFFLENGYSTATVQGRSMQPTFNPDSNKLSPDIVLLSHWGAIGHKFQRGEVVAMTSPHNPDLTITKRIIALEGDSVRPLPQSDQKSVVYVPKGHCWVEGDERFHSRDSNAFGTVPMGLINSKVVYILWPLSRFGKVEIKPNVERVSAGSVDSMRL
ncbi:peptidase S24/S26A/S26B/S26C [Umbelopsis sp. AD052]|nr:peptidase S24/S26A/S26B/S26C [Umbelopsis sp. AD052]